MAGWNGTGTFTGPTYTWVNDLNAGVVITASRFDQNDTDYTAGINACMAKNGENAATGNLNIGGFRLTSVGNATSRTDALTAAQAQDGSAGYILASGTNTIAAALAPAITAYANGQAFWLKIANTTTAAATLNFNAVGALNIYYSDGTTALVAGSLIQNNIYEFAYDSSLNAAAGGFICINPSRVTGSATITQTGYASPPTGTLFYAVEPSGKMAIAWTTATITGTSNATSMTWTGIPAVLTTSVSLRLLAASQDNTGAFAWNSLDTGTSTTWTFNAGVNSGNFTASGTKATARGTFVFPIT